MVAQLSSQICHPAIGVLQVFLQPGAAAEIQTLVKLGKSSSMGRNGEHLERWMGFKRQREKKGKEGKAESSRAKSRPPLKVNTQLPSFLGSDYLTLIRIPAVFWEEGGRLGIGSVVERLPSIYVTLGSIPSVHTHTHTPHGGGGDPASSLFELQSDYGWMTQMDSLFVAHKVPSLL